MKNSKIVFVVLGYARPLEAIKKYLDYSMVRLVFEMIISPHDYFVVITSGGKTRALTAPDISEAQLMADYIKSRVSDIYAHIVFNQRFHSLAQSQQTSIQERLQILTDEQALTTQQNLEGIKRILKEEDVEAKEIHITVDSCRSLKARIFGLIILKRFCHMHKFNLTKRFVTKVKQLMFITPADIAVCISKQFGIRYFERKQLDFKKAQIAKS